jgi:hypothetical protein
VDGGAGADECAEDPDDDVVEDADDTSEADDDEVIIVEDPGAPAPDAARV